MRNETNATGALDSRSVGLPKHHHAKSLAGALSAFEDGRRFMPEGSIAKSYYPDPAEVKDGSPVASVGMDYFRFMAEAAVDQGFISSEGLTRVMDALNREVIS